MAQQTTQIISLQDFTGGIGSDRYLPYKNGCYDGEGLDIRRCKRVILGTHNRNDIVATKHNDKITAMSSNTYISDGGYIYNNAMAELYKIKGTNNTSNLRNFTQFTMNGTSYTVLIGPAKLSRYSGNLPFQYQNVSRPATSADWINTGLQMVKNGSSTVPFTATITSVVAGEYYRVRIVTTNITAGNVTVTLGGAGSTVISTNTETIIWVTASTTAGLVFTPSATFDGWISFSTDVGLGVVEEEFATLTGTSSYQKPILEDTGDLYIGSDNKLFILDNLGVVTTKLTFTEGTVIVGITKIDDQFIIWTNNGQGSVVYYRDGVADAPARTIYWYNEIIWQVINKGNYHIVMTGGDFGIKKLWRSNGNSKDVMYEIRQGTWLYTTGNTLVPPLPLYWGGNAANQWTNNVESLGDLVFMPGYNKLLVYGKRIPGLPDSMFCDFALKTTEISAMYAYEGELRVAFNNAGVNSVITWKLDNYESMQDGSLAYYFGDRGYISFNPIVFLSSQEKNAIRIKIGKKTPTNTMMNIYYALDREVDRYTFVVDENINPVTTDPAVGSVYDNNSTIGRFEVTKVTKLLNYMFIEVKETVRYETPRINFTLNKISGTGDSAITYVDFHNYRHFDYISNKNEFKDRQWSRLFNENFTEIQFRIELITRDGKITPELNDFNLSYDNLPND